MTNSIAGFQGAAGIIKLKLTKAMSAMPSPPPAGNNGLRLNSKSLPWEHTMQAGMWVRMVTMRIQMRRNLKSCNLVFNELALHADDQSMNNVGNSLWWPQTTYEGASKESQNYGNGVTGVVLQKGGDVGWHGDGVGIKGVGGSIHYYNKEGEYGIVTSNDVVWLWR